MKKNGKQTIVFDNPPVITGYASVVGKKEGEGRLKEYFDYITDDDKFGEKTWEKAESRFVLESTRTAIKKAGLTPGDIDYIFSGDLLNQCTGSNYAVRELGIPFFGLYGACSTMAESLCLAAMVTDGGYSKNTLAATSSHFCSSERQFRFPLEYGSTRPATSQWTVTGSGASVVSKKGKGPLIQTVTIGKIIDLGIKDANNMGAAMAPAALDTIICHFNDLNRSFEDYDLVVTGDLGTLGNKLLYDMFEEKGYKPQNKLTDCGMMIFDCEKQDVHCGGSGCGCSASVLNSYLLKSLEAGKYKNILFVATGALMSTVASQQGESIPGIAHAVGIGV